MTKFKESNLITKNSYELLLPNELISKGYLAKTGILQCGISKLRKGSVISRISNRAYHILIFSISGEGVFIMENGLEIVLHPGQLFFSNAEGQGHKHYPKTEEWELCWFWISKECRWITQDSNDYMVKSSIHHDDIRYCLEQLLNENRLKLTEYTAMQELYGQLLHLHLKREVDTSILAGYQQEYLIKFNRLWNDISQSADQPWDIQHICQYMNLSRAHVTRLCKIFYKKSPADMVREIRMKYAYSLLANLNLQVATVAELSGYNSISSFSVAFKAYFGMAPNKAKEKSENPNPD